MLSPLKAAAGWRQPCRRAGMQSRSSVSVLQATGNPGPAAAEATGQARESMQAGLPLPATHLVSRREQAVYLEGQGRDWQAVEAFWADVVAGRACLSDIGAAPAKGYTLLEPRGQDTESSAIPGPAPGSQQAAAGTDTDGSLKKIKSSKGGPNGRVRRTYKMAVSYLGSAFDGWAAQPGLSTVEGTVVQALQAAVAAAYAEGEGAAPALASDSSCMGEVKASAAQTSRPLVGEQQQVEVLGAAEAASQREAGQEPSIGGSKAKRQGAKGGKADDREQALKHGGVSPAGRTDKGVSAVGQVVSFYSWQPLSLGHVSAAIEAASAGILGAPAPSATAQPAAEAALQAGASEPAQAGPTPVTASSGPCLRITSFSEVPRSFHATFAAQWRRYVYILPLRGQQASAAASQPPQIPEAESSQGEGQGRGQGSGEERSEEAGSGGQGLVNAACLPDVDPHRVHEMLQPLVGQALDYGAFARDTPPGKDFVCKLLLARAWRGRLPVPPPPSGLSNSCGDSSRGSGSGSDIAEGGSCGPEVLCIELVGDRFLRRMVRVLVGTLALEAAVTGTDMGGAGPAGPPGDRQQLLRLCGQGMAGRTATAVPAPALGLCFAGVGYDSS